MLAVNRLLTVSAEKAAKIQGVYVLAEQGLFIKQLSVNARLLKRTIKLANTIETRVRVQIEVRHFDR